MYYHELMKTLVLIDSNAIVHRAYHALPKNLSNSKGELTNVTYGFALALIKILEELHPDYIAAAFDLAAPTFRHKEYKEYKAKRVKADQELYDQIPRVREMLAAFGVPIYAVEGFEADDILGTIVEQCLKKSEIHPPAGGPKSETNYKSLNPNDKKVSNFDIRDSDLMIYIASGDRDVYQLLNGHVQVLMLRKGFSEAEIFDHKHLKEVYNLEPSDFIDLKALMGDSSDNIPGIPGIGPKTATDLVLKFDTLEKLYEQLDSKTTGQQDSKEIAKELGIKERILKLLIEYKDQAFKSQMLATIRRDVPIDFDLEGARWGNYDSAKVRALFEELEFKSLLKRFGKDYEEEDKAKTKEITEEQKKKDEQLRLEL